MHLIRLSPAKIKEIYRCHVTRDFPDDERKPLGIILKARKNGNYLCLGAEQDGILVGYAFLVKHSGHYLLDYFAVTEGFRHKGLGTDLLTLLRQNLSGALSILAEVEDPDSAADESEHRLRERRLAFYLRSGFRDTGVTALTFGVEYRLLEMALEQTHSSKEITQLYRNHYRANLPKELFRAMVKV